MLDMTEKRMQIQCIAKTWWQFGLQVVHIVGAWLREKGHAR